MLSEECVEDISIKRPYFYTIKEYALSSTIHGIGYIFETNRLIFERLLWIIVLIVAVLIGTLLSIYTYKSWQDDPILTSVGTTGFPIEKIEFPNDVHVFPRVFPKHDFLKHPKVFFFGPRRKKQKSQDFFKTMS